MIHIEYTEDTKYFLDVCSQLHYKDKDELEAKDILNSSSGSVYEVISNAGNRWADHFIIYWNNKVICTITLDIYNNLHYFVTKDLNASNSLSFIKTIKKLANKYVKHRKVLFVTTRDWYTEAVKFNKLIGFKPYKTNSGKQVTTWYLAKNKGY